MKLFFDSSVLVAVFYADHPHHAISEDAFLAGPRDGSFCALASLGEVYNVLTGMPLRPRITGADGIDIVHQIQERLTLVSLTPPEYIAGLESAAARVIGGAVYDALIARCAIKSGADILLTWNERDFLRLGEPVASLVQTPRDWARRTGAGVPGGERS